MNLPSKVLSGALVVFGFLLVGLPILISVFIGPGGLSLWPNGPLEPAHFRPKVPTVPTCIVFHLTYRLRFQILHLKIFRLFKQPMEVFSVLHQTRWSQMTFKTGYLPNSLKIYNKSSRRLRL